MHSQYHIPLYIRTSIVISTSTQIFLLPAAIPAALQRNTQKFVGLSYQLVGVFKVRLCPARVAHENLNVMHGSPFSDKPKLARGIRVPLQFVSGNSTFNAHGTAGHSSSATIQDSSASSCNGHPSGDTAGFENSRHPTVRVQGRHAGLERTAVMPHPSPFRHVASVRARTARNTAHAGAGGHSDGCRSPVSLTINKAAGLAPTPAHHRPKRVRVQRARHPPVIAAALNALAQKYPLRRPVASEPEGEHARLMGKWGVAGTCVQVHSRHSWREKVDTSRKFRKGKRVEIRGGGYYPPAVGDLVSLHVGTARVSHVGGFRNFADVRSFLHDAPGLVRAVEEDFVDMAGSTVASFEGGAGFWVALEFYPVLFVRDE
eukprot:3583868-Rhodomonas_salina.3